jgi:preprotein translocase subunit SecE
LLEADNHSSAHRICRAGRDLVLGQAQAVKLNLNWQLSMARVSPAQFVRQVRQEVSRISWASRRETGTATLTVFVMVAIAAVFFLLVDMVLSNVVQFVLGLGG